MELMSPPTPGSVLIPVKLREVLIHCLGLTVTVFWEVISNSATATEQRDPTIAAIVD